MLKLRYVVLAFSLIPLIFFCATVLGNEEWLQATTKRKCTLFTETNATKPFAGYKLSAGQTVDVSYANAKQGVWWRVDTEKHGLLYTVASCFRLTTKMEAAMKKGAALEADRAALQEEAERKAEKEAVARRAEAAKQRLADLRLRFHDKKTVAAILTHDVFVGMSEAAVLESWGKPQHINETINARGTSAQWVYDDNNYLYFENGELRSIQTKR